jgi:hypothetical protein
VTTGMRNDSTLCVVYSITVNFLQPCVFIESEVNILIVAMCCQDVWQVMLNDVYDISR